MLRRSSFPMLAIEFAAVSLAACGGVPESAKDSLSTVSEALTGSQAIARAQQWVSAEVPYCQSPNGQPDADPSCSPVCMRPTVTAWDPYRSDCSGFVSWAWNLPAPGRTTDEFAPAVTDITKVIDGSELQPGDALNVPADHIILFVSWIMPGVSANFMEEPGCSATPNYAHAFTSNVQISGSSVTVEYEGNTFTAIRYTGITGDADGGAVVVPDAGGATDCTVSTTGQSGVCILTSACAALGDHTSTPGYCPGANDIQCCTANGCTGNSQCSGGSPICNTATGACRACDSNSDCSMGVCATGSSDPDRGKCVQCTDDSNCTSPAVCDTATDTCTQCDTNAQCSGLKPVCAAGTCEGCRSDSDCSSNAQGNVCDTSGAQKGACVPAAPDGGSVIEPVDGGTRPEDAGWSPEDAGSSREDAGSSREDAGSSREDAGSSREDAGSIGDDAGTGAQAGAGGCATGGGSVAIWVLPFAMIAMRRRTKRYAG